MQELTIQSETKKGRAFSATMLNCIVANQFWPEGKINETKVSRPVYASFAGTEAELRAFIANLRSGRKAQSANSSSYRWNHNTFEFLRSIKYRFLWQKHQEGSICTVFLPDLFIIDPGIIESDEIKFIMLPTLETIQNQVITISHPETISYYEKYHKNYGPNEVALATLFSIMLSRRISLPYPADPKFFLQLYWACQERGILKSLLSRSSRDSYRELIHAEARGMYQELGFYEPMAFLAEQSTFRELLVNEVSSFF